MKTIGIVDCDLIDGGTRFPNLAAMKISAYEKSVGNATRLCLSPGDSTECDELRVSKVFTRTKTPDFVEAFPGRVERGGTGFDLYGAAPLPREVERIKPDYSLYAPFVESFGDKKPVWLEFYEKAAVGFTTRGCFRGCKFCVNRDKRKVERWSRVEEFDDDSRKFLIMLDDNVFGYKNCAEIFDEIERNGKPFQFKQGLDMRLMDESKAEFLGRSRYKNRVFFALDNAEEIDLFSRKAEIYRSRCDKRTTAYVLVGFYKDGVDELNDFFDRLECLKKFRILPYVMKHAKYEASPIRSVYVEAARWVNQPNFFKKLTLAEFIDRGGSKESKRVLRSKEIEPVANRLNVMYNGE